MKMANRIYKLFNIPVEININASINAYVHFKHDESLTSTLSAMKYWFDSSAHIHFSILLIVFDFYLINNAIETILFTPSPFNILANAINFLGNVICDVERCEIAWRFNISYVLFNA